MKVKSARSFRNYYKTEIKHIRKDDSSYDENFIGCEYKKEDGSFVKGLFEMFHGDKKDEGAFLSNFLKIAEDGQAIYEFLQNAADCGSTLFYLFYNEKYFLAVNNGKAFNRKGLHSLLNVAQSTKEDASQIGRFGIGFKLVHRLVGKGDGKEEIVNGLKGPMLFSWSKKSDLEALLSGEIPEDDNNIEDDSNLPFLLKLILTNFPAGMDEVVKDLNYKDKVLFPKEEYEEMSAYVKEQLTQYVDKENLNQGSIFFIKLGEGKKKLLDADYEKNFKIGVEYSLNTLKGLKNIKVNGTQIEEVPLVLENSQIEKDSEEFNEISPEYKDSDIHFSVGYIRIDFAEEKPFEKIEALKNSPTFYKYFPLADELHKSALFVHCDSFSNEVNRRKLHSDNINNALFPQIAKFVIGKLEEYKNNDWDKYCQLYANALLCETPNGNSEWLGTVFFNLIRNYLKINIPTKERVCSSNSNHVCICRVKSTIAADKEVRGDLEWFLWDEFNVRELANAASSKLDVSYIYINDFIKRCDKNRIREWVTRHHNSSEYDELMNELFGKDSRYDIKDLFDIPLFAFSNGVGVSSFNGIVQTNINESEYKTANLIFITNHTIEVKDILQKIGFYVSEINIDQYPKLKNGLPLPKDKLVFDELNALLAQGNTLNKFEKERLIQWLCGSNKLEGIANESIKKLRLYKNAVGEFNELGELISADINVPQWLTPYQIDKSESSPILKQFQIDVSYIYARIIREHWSEITSALNNDAEEFYSTVKQYYEMDKTNSNALQSENYIMKQDGTFVKADGCFYSSLLPKDRAQYVKLNNAIKTLLDDELPDYDIVEYLCEEPFKTDDSSVTDYNLEDGSVDDLDMKALVDFAIANKDDFFAKFVVVKNGEFWTLQDKTSSFCQVYTNSNSKRKFIEEHCKDSMSLLPSFLNEHKEEKGVLRGDELDEYILETVEADVDELSEELLLVLNQEGQHSLLSRLGEVEFDLDKGFDKDSYEFKLVMTAISFSDDDQEVFRNKVFVVKKGKRYEYNQIPPSVDKVHIEGAKKDFDLSELLPNERQNSNLRNELVMKFSDSDINQEKLKMLFEVTSDCDVADVFEQLKSNYKVLENAQQLAFALLMEKNERGKKDCFKAESRRTESEPYAIDTTFYLNAYPFISKDYVLAKKYSDLEKYVKLPIGKIYSKPFITEDDEFVCDGVNDELDDEAKTALLTFIDELRQDRKGLSEISFDNIGEKDVEKILGFNPSEAIAEVKYALDEEVLPRYVLTWLEESAERRDTLVDLGVCFEDSEVVCLR